MQWEFRKALETFEGYKKSITYKNEIQNGEEGTLNVVLREIELILADKNEKIITKVLGLRFVRDIMVLGQQDVVKRVEKLIPQLTKICSHELGSSDPDRGQTYFYDHPSYLKLTDEQEKKQIGTLGSTFLILSLESIYHWAKWIHLDSSGQQSIYARAYQNLIDRGVKFPTSFHYYKQSDTQKFKNMYKMEFFTDSYDSAYSGMPSEVQPSNSLDNRSSRVSINGNNRSFHVDNKSRMADPRQNQGVVQQYTGESRGLRSISQIMNYLNSLRKQKSRKMGDIREINRKVQQIYEVQMQKRGLGKDQKKWIESYLINFGLLNSNLINYQQFLQRCVSQNVQISNIQQQDISVDHKFSKFATSRSPNTLRTQPNKTIHRQIEGDQGEDLLKKQEMQYKMKMNGLLMELQQRSNQIAIVKSNADKERAKLIEDYQSRIILIKSEVKRGQQDRGAFQKELQKENQRLRSKAASLEQELATYNYSTARQRDLESERNQLLTKVKKLQIQNQKLAQIKSNKNSFQKQMATLEASLKEKESLLERTRAQLRKSEKQIQNYSDEAALYKSQLINERNKHDQKISTLTKNVEAFENENKQLKQKQLELRKTLDLKEIEILSIRQELKRYQGKLKDMGERKEQIIYNRSEPFVKSRALMQSPARNTGHDTQVYSNEKGLKFNNYQDLYLQLRPNNKQLFIRLCRCGLKKKDILLKDNEVQVGMISEIVSNQCLKFILHFTNTSQKQVQNLKLDYNLPHSYVSTLDYQIDNKFVFCIQPQEQEKIVISVTNKESPYLKQRAILQLSYDKNGVSYTTNLFLPFVIAKFFDFYRPKPFTLPEKSRNAREIIQLKFNRKMLPKPSSIRSYFQQVEETSTNQFEVDGHHRETDLSVRIQFKFTPETQTLLLDVLALKEKINDRQRYVLQELVSFIEAAFKK